VRLIDYDFSGASDPCFDLGDVAMEGSYSPDDLERLCESYAGERTPVLAARARLFGIAAQYTWSLLFVGMDALLPVKPDAGFDYFREASERWDWARARLQEPDLDVCIEGLAP
jgi:thiamine kinase-like enzyme